MNPTLINTQTALTESLADSGIQLVILFAPLAIFVLGSLLVITMIVKLFILILDEWFESHPDIPESNSVFWDKNAPENWADKWDRFGKSPTAKDFEPHSVVPKI